MHGSQIQNIINKKYENKEFYCIMSVRDSILFVWVRTSALASY